MRDNMSSVFLSTTATPKNIRLALTRMGYAKTLKHLFLRQD